MTREELMDLYDERCMHISTAVRAIWLLYLRDNWTLLEELGLDKATYKPTFLLFLMEFLAGNEGWRIRREVEVRALVRLCPAVLDAAITLTGKYTSLMAPLEKEQAA